MKLKRPTLYALSLFVLPVVISPAGLTADDATPIMHPLESVCVAYEVAGDYQTGSTTRCHRDFGYEQYEIMKLTMEMAGFTQSTNSHNITIGDTIYSINLDTQSGTKTINPYYQNMVTALENSDPEELSAAFMSTMGFTPTEETRTIAGTQCQVYSSGQMGTACLTSDGLMLEQSMMGMTTTAINVQMGEGGEDSNYTLYQTVEIVDGPDLSNFNLQDLMNNN